MGRSHRGRFFTLGSNMRRPRGRGKGKQRKSGAARSWGGSAAKGGSHGANSGADAGSAHRPMRHEQLPWFPPLALCIKT
ncbi:MAG: hypothetical protein F6J98_35835 [Moorea sp. SIO4G2]|nr:hypothetical protein [Moorena sp. SIO4G2]